MSPLLQVRVRGLGCLVTCLLRPWECGVRGIQGPLPIAMWDLGCPSPPSLPFPALLPVTQPRGVRLHSVPASTPQPCCTQGVVSGALGPCPLAPSPGLGWGLRETRRQGAPGQEDFLQNAGAQAVDLAGRQREPVHTPLRSQPDPGLSSALGSLAPPRPLLPHVGLRWAQVRHTGLLFRWGCPTVLADPAEDFWGQLLVTSGKVR